MKTSLSRPTALFSLVAGIAIATAASAADAPAAGAAKGDLWQTTSQMSMEGMPFKMPAQTAKRCIAKSQTEPPVPPNPQAECRNSNMQRDGNKVTWQTQCTGPDMTGVGEITYADASNFTGTIKYNSAQGNMTIALTGKKLEECPNPN